MTTIDLPRDSTLERVADSLAILASSKASEMTMDWQTLARLVKTGGAKSILSIGDLIEESWTDKSPAEPKAYSLPWGVRHFGRVELADGTTVNGMYLETQYAHVKSVQFSHPRAFLRCPEGLSAGTYYFTFGSNWRYDVVAGGVVCFTLTQDVPVGGRIAGCYLADEKAKDTWRIYSYDASGKTIIETVNPTFEASGTDLGIQKLDSRNGNLNSTREMAHGWNRWSTSACRQYLNSEKGVGEWWTAQDEWDIAPDQLNQIPGFLSGLPRELIDAMLPVRTRTYLNTANDKAYYGMDYDDTYDKVFLPSLEQIYAVTQVEDEGDAWDYWKLISRGVRPNWNGDYPELTRYDTGDRNSPRYVRLRSSYIGTSSATWMIYPSGSISGKYGASRGEYAMQCCPCCVIGRP